MGQPVDQLVRLIKKLDEQLQKTTIACLVGKSARKEWRSIPVARSCAVEVQPCGDNGNDSQDTYLQL